MTSSRHWLRALALLVVSGLALVHSAFGQGTENIGAIMCDELTKSPDKYVGRRVAFYGSVTRFDMKPVNGKEDTVSIWTCKDKDGKVVVGQFGTLGSEAQWTDAAKKANFLKSLFIVSGIVRGSEVVNSSINPILKDTIPFLKDVAVRLSSEVK